MSNVSSNSTSNEKMKLGSFCHHDVLMFEKFSHICTISKLVGMFRNDFNESNVVGFSHFLLYLTSIQLILSTVLSNASDLIVDIQQQGGTM